jgi:hypothetical protein
MESGENNNPPQGEVNPRPRPSMDGFRPADRSNYARPVDRPNLAPQPVQPAQAPPTPTPAVEPAPPVDQPAQPGVAAPAPAQPLQFTPPPKKPRRGRKILLIGGIVIAAAAIFGGGYAYLHAQSVRNRPETVLKDALLNDLSMPRVHLGMINDGGAADVQYDFSDSKHPVTSSVITFTQAGKFFGLKGYGTTDATYFSYVDLPSEIDAKLASSVKNGWIQMRSSGKLPVGADTGLSQQIDPRSLIIGPVLHANLDQKTRQQIADFELSQKMYQYDSLKVEKKVNGKLKVMVFHITPNIGFLKVANQSLAASMGFTPDDVQSAVDALDVYKGSIWTVQIDRKTHRIVELDITLANQKTVTYQYGVDTKEMPNEPQTKVTWAYFAPYQKQLLDEAAGKTAPSTPTKR